MLDTRTLMLAAGIAVTLLLPAPSLARESKEIAASCEQVIRNSAQMHGGPALGSTAAEANYRECWENSVLSRDGRPANLVKICREELDRRGRRPGTPEWDKDYRQCIERETTRTAPVQAAVTACLANLRGGSAKFGSPAWDAAYEGCMQRSNADRSSIAEADPKPFGRGRVRTYLNAVYHGDLATLRSMDADLSVRLGAMYQVRGYKASLLERILANYLIHYPVAYRNCLPADSPKVTIGGVVERITKRGGEEVSREIIDTRRDIPVAKHLHALATRVKPDPGDSDFDDRLMKGLTGVDLEELRGSHISQVVAEVMNGLQCTDPVAKQLDANLVKYSAVLLP
jgi:hypothetical protein